MSGKIQMGKILGEENIEGGRALHVFVWQIAVISHEAGETNDFQVNVQDFFLKWARNSGSDFLKC